MWAPSISWITILAASCTSLTSARAEDTYNFYFQKAPGPVTVNQGTTQKAEPAPSPSSPPPNAAETAAARTAAVTVMENAEEEAKPNRRKWRFSFGIADGADLFPESTTAPFGKNVRQLALGLQYNPIDLLGLEAQVFAVKDPKVPGEISSYIGNARVGGSPYDGSLGLVLTPLRSGSPGSSFRLALSATGGITTVPLLKLANRFHGGFDYVHEQAPYFGARAELEFLGTAAIQASAKRINRYNNTIGAFSLAYLF